MWQSWAGAGVLVVKVVRVLMILRERSGETSWRSGRLVSGQWA
ncbi:MAG TPA: hypothetical protein VKQ36_00370 [Ktedonobacterales bacterium]|nr:hypothetical protein [Ktedonobacterales bacterium]